MINAFLFNFFCPTIQLNKSSMNYEVKSLYMNNFINARIAVELIWP